MGDPAGIGPEISLKALEYHHEYQQSTVIYGSYGVLKYYHDALKMKTPLARIDSVGDFKPGCINVISVVELEVGKDFKIGQVSAAAGDGAYGL